MYKRQNIAGTYQHFGLALKDAFFQVGSIITTTGYSTVNFDLWPSFSKGILLLLMLVGGSAGSTAGGIKVIRVLTLFKLIKREIAKIFHPRAYVPVKVDKKVVPDDTLSSITSFLALYLLILVPVSYTHLQFDLGLSATDLQHQHQLAGHA